MDRLAQEHLHTAASKAREAAALLSAAYAVAGLAVLAKGPDFRERIFSIGEMCHALAADINNVAGPLEAHEGVRKVVEHPDGACGRPGCIICLARKAATDGPLHGRAGFGG